jgi:hypothetical protein
MPGVESLEQITRGQLPSCGPAEDAQAKRR